MFTRLHVLLLSTLVAAGACASSVPSPAAPAARAGYAICVMYGVAASGPSLEIHTRAQAAFDAAETHFERGRLDDAARGFHDAAMILLEGRRLNRRTPSNETGESPTRTW